MEEVAFEIEYSDEIKRPIDFSKCNTIRAEAKIIDTLVKIPVLPHGALSAEAVYWGLLPPNPCWPFIPALPRGEFWLTSLKEGWNFHSATAVPYQTVSIDSKHYDKIYCSYLRKHLYFAREKTS